MNLTRSRGPVALLCALGLLFAAGCGDDDAPAASTASAGTTGDTSVGAAAPEGTPTNPASAPGALDPAPTGDVLIQAAAQATEGESYRYEMQFELSGLPEMTGVSLNFEATGEADAENKRARVALDLGPLVAMMGMSGLTPEEQAEMDALLGDGTLELIVAADAIYVRWPMIASMLGATTPWVSLDQSMLGEEATPAAGMPSFGYDPSMTLTFLESLEDVEEVGTATVRGVETTQYHGLVTWESVLAQLPPEERALMETELEGAEMPAFPTMPVDVWVDGDNLVRRYAMTLDLAEMAAEMAADMGATPTPDDAAGVFTFSYELFDFGESVTVDLPADSEVTPLTEEMMFGGGMPATY